MKNCYDVRIAMRAGRKSYTFRAILKKSSFPDGSEGYFVSVPGLEHLGAATQGRTREEAVRNIRDVLSLMVREFAAEGRDVPVASARVAGGTLITVTA